MPSANVLRGDHSEIRKGKRPVLVHLKKILSTSLFFLFPYFGREPLVQGMFRAPFLYGFYKFGPEGAKMFHSKEPSPLGVCVEIRPLSLL